MVDHYTEPVRTDSDNGRMAGWLVIFALVALAVLAGWAAKYDAEHTPHQARIEGR